MNIRTYIVDKQVWRGISLIELVIVRHGQSVADIEERHEGRADFPLTDLGRQQAAKLAVWLKEKFNFDLIISSPLKRAVETTEIINQEYNIEIEYDNSLMELNNGVLAGLLRAEAQERYPMPEGGRKYFERVPNGESMIEFRVRAEEFLSQLIYDLSKENKDKRVLIVAHGGSISMLFQSFLNLPIDNECSINTGDTGVHIWRANARSRRIVFANLSEHLKEEICGDRLYD